MLLAEHVVARVIAAAALSVAMSACAVARELPAGQVAPAAGEIVSVEGRLENAGTNYFTDLRLEVADAKAGRILIQPWLPRSVAPGPAQQPAPITQADYLGRAIRIRGVLETKPMKGIGVVRALRVLSVELLDNK